MKGGERIMERSIIVEFNMEDFKRMIGSTKTNQSSIEQLTFEDVRKNIDECIAKLMHA